jgi:RNA polymerase sigma-70 factor (ECF subfamily)
LKVVRDDRTSDSELAEALRNGRTDALEKLVERYNSMVFSICYRLLNSKDESHDATQQVFLNVLRGVAKFRGNSSFKTWLYSIALNECRSRLKRKKIFEEIDVLLDIKSIDPLQERTLETRRRKEALRASLKSLPFKQRAAVTLRINDEMPFSEIARSLGCSVNSAKVNFQHGMNRLKEIIAGSYDEKK